MGLWTKALLIFIIPVLLLQNCLVLEEMGLEVMQLSPEHEKGFLVRERLMVTAIAVDLTVSSALYQAPQVSALSLIAGDLAEIKDEEFYANKDVNNCIGKIQGEPGLLFSGGLGAYFCKLEPYDVILEGIR